MASWDTLQLSCCLSTEGIFPQNPVLPVFGCRVKRGVNGAEPRKKPKMIKKWNMVEQRNYATFDGRRRSMYFHHILENIFKNISF